MAVTILILWTAFASVFALMLGYSRIPFAAARDGYFFRVFGRLHPTKDFPNISLIVIAAVAIVAAFRDLSEVINVLLTTRILVQFIAQIFALPLLRKRLGNKLPFRMPLYPLPAIVALLGWCYIFGTSGKTYITYGLVSLFMGVIVFLVHARTNRTWPFRTDDTISVARY